MSVLLPPFYPSLLAKMYPQQMWCWAGFNVVTQWSIHLKGAWVLTPSDLQHSPGPPTEISKGERKQCCSCLCYCIWGDFCYSLLIYILINITILCLGNLLRIMSQESTNIYLRRGSDGSERLLLLTLDPQPQMRQHLREAQGRPYLQQYCVASS